MTAIATVTGAEARALESELLALCVAVFPGFDAAYLAERLPHVDAPAATIARDGAGRLIGFKLGYRQGGTLFYSWLGGVHPDARRQGIAARLMAEQHRWAAGAGYAHVQTRTRAANRAMIILNLQAGFEIAGFEIDKAGIPVVVQRLGL